MALSVSEPSFVGQGYGYVLSLNPGDRVNINFHEMKPIWPKGVVSWTTFSESGGTLTLEHSLTEAAWWTPDPTSPLSGYSEGIEEFPIARMRFIAAGADATISILTPVHLKWDTESI